MQQGRDVKGRYVGAMKAMKSMHLRILRCTRLKGASEHGRGKAKGKAKWKGKSVVMFEDWETMLKRPCGSDLDLMEAQQGGLEQLKGMKKAFLAEHGIDYKKVNLDEPIVMFCTQ